MNKQDRALRERNLLEAALRQFSTRAWDEVSVAQIAELAGVAKGTVYLHFASKHEICAVLTREFLQDLLTLLTRKKVGNGRAQLLQLIQNTFTYHCDQERYKNVVRYCQHEQFKKKISHALLSDLQCLEIQHHRVFANTLQRGCCDGSLQATANKSLNGVLCTLHGALHHLWCAQNWQQENQLEFIESTTNYIMSGVDRRVKTKSKINTLPLPSELSLES